MREFWRLRYRLFYPVPKARAIGTTFGVPVQKTRTKGHMQPVPLDIFLVVKLASQINFAHVNTNHVVDSLGYNHAYLLKPICVLRACKFFFLLKILTRMCHVFLYVGSSDEFFSVEIHPVRILLREQDIYE